MYFFQVAVGVGGEEAANVAPDTPPDNFANFTRNMAEDNNEEGGLLYHQTRHSGEGEMGEGSGGGAQGMEGTEDNAANWNRPSTR